MRDGARRPLGRDEAEALAIQALAFLAGRPEELGRFLALAGLGPTNLRDAAADPAFLAGVIDFLLLDDALLLTFAEDARLPPAAIGEAARALAAGR